MKAWTKLGDFRGDSAFSSWVCGIVSRVAIDQVRKRVPVMDSAETSPESVGGTVEALALGDAIEVALGRLPVAERSVFVLHEVTGLRYREIAAHLEIPIGTVMSRLSSARVKLRAELADWKEIA